MLEAAAKKEYGRLQSVIISSLSPENNLEYAKRMAAGALCRNGGDGPCGKCASCRKISEDIHPDVMIIRRGPDSKNGEKKEITVDQVRSLTREAYIMPNESDRRIFIISEADLMNTSAQNAALKLLEEPPNNSLLLLCAVSPQRLLPTVRSRCTEMNIQGDKPAADKKFAALAEEYLRFAAENDMPGLTAWCYKNEGMSTAEFQIFLDSLRETLAAMLGGKRDTLGLSRQELMRLLELNTRCLEYRKVNGSVKLAFGLLMARTVRL